MVFEEYFYQQAALHSSLTNLQDSIWKIVQRYIDKQNIPQENYWGEYHWKTIQAFNYYGFLSEAILDEFNPS